MNIRIHLHTDDKDVLRRIWWFSEDLYLKFRDSDLAHLPLGEVDAVTTDLLVRVKSRSKLRRSRAVIEDALRQHDLFEIAVLTEENGVDS
ncbi:hypothetical protein RPMA_22120 [Tardiphaga alba]|uniref:Uncharacterized protein n=1 Tax=Tardiphaga alba TaxID=340268 RepID=A0ABX8AHE3_9BRAD|nr:hypothetical protein [Tardiphaga alba]QUS41240.1 hypothetical protein RPMA_22120 [Tardiphaga alba]